MSFPTSLKSGIASASLSWVSSTLCIHFLQNVWRSICASLCIETLSCNRSQSSSGWLRLMDDSLMPIPTGLRHGGLPIVKELQRRRANFCLQLCRRQTGSSVRWRRCRRCRREGTDEAMQPTPISTFEQSIIWAAQTNHHVSVREQDDFKVYGVKAHTVCLSHPHIC